MTLPGPWHSITPFDLPWPLLNMFGAGSFGGFGQESTSHVPVEGDGTFVPQQYGNSVVAANAGAGGTNLVQEIFCGFTAVAFDRSFVDPTVDWTTDVLARMAPEDPPAGMYVAGVEWADGSLEQVSTIDRQAWIQRIGYTIDLTADAGNEDAPPALLFRMPVGVLDRGDGWHYIHPGADTIPADPMFVPQSLLPGGYAGGDSPANLGSFHWRFTGNVDWDPVNMGAGVLLVANAAWPGQATPFPGPPFFDYPDTLTGLPQTVWAGVKAVVTAVTGSFHVAPPNFRYLYDWLATPPLRQRQRSSGIGAVPGPPLRQRLNYDDTQPPLRQRQSG